MVRPTQPALPRRRQRPGEAAHDRRPKQVARVVRSGAERQHAIAVAAYFRAEHRGFAAGSELTDWLAAEREVDGLG